MFISDFWMVFTSEGFSPSVVQSRIFQYCLSISNRSRGSEMAGQERWERDWTVFEEGTELGDGLRKFLRWMVGRNPILSPVLKGFFEVFNALCSLHLPPRSAPVYDSEVENLFRITKLNFLELSRTDSAAEGGKQKRRQILNGIEINIVLEKLENESLIL